MNTHHKAKLSFADVKLMRQQHMAYIVGYGELAKRFKCGVSTARDIINFKTRLSR